MILLKLFTRRWIIPTLVVIAGAIFLVYLGIWQLDRQDQRREYNEMVTNRWLMDPLELDPGSADNLLSDLEFRRVAVSGEFDYAHQVALKNQNFQDQPGIQLVTPLILDEGQAILVVRGWIPYAQSTSDQWPQFNESVDATIVGRAHESQMMPSGEAPEIPNTPQSEWFRLNVDAIQPQMPYELLPFFIYQLPEGGRSYGELPIRQNLNPLLDLRDPVMHLSYAIQWFSFSLILLFTYIQLVRHQERRAKRQDGNTPTMGEEQLPADGIDSTLGNNNEPLERPGA